MANEKEAAVRLLNSERGSYLIGQALYIAIREMNKQPIEKRRYSDTEDLILIMEQLFPGYLQSEVAEYEFRRTTC